MTRCTAPRGGCSRSSGERLEVESPHPRAQATQRRGPLDGRVLESVEAVGKNLLLRFDGGIVVRSHLRLSGRWVVDRAATRGPGCPGSCSAATSSRVCSGTGRCSSCTSRAHVGRLGPDILASPLDLDATVARMRGAADRRLGETLQDQRLVAGIGNMWMAEALWTIQVSPWVRVGEASDDCRATRSRPAAG